MKRSPGLTVTLVAAVAEDGSIGTGRGGIPWRLPRDAAHFRATVAGKAVLVGRRTYGEMRGWFRTERPIVLTADPSFKALEGAARVARSLDEALRIASGDGETELMVCGGASVYRQALPLATRMILTHVDARPGDADPGAARFPDHDPADWTLEREVTYPADEENAHAMRFAWYRRSNPPAGS